MLRSSLVNRLVLHWAEEPRKPAGADSPLRPTALAPVPHGGGGGA